MSFGRLLVANRRTGRQDPHVRRDRSAPGRPKMSLRVPRPRGDDSPDASAYVSGSFEQPLLCASGASIFLRQAAHAARAATDPPRSVLRPPGQPPVASRAPQHAPRTEFGKSTSRAPPAARARPRSPTCGLVGPRAEPGAPRHDGRAPGGAVGARGGAPQERARDAGGPAPARGGADRAGARATHTETTDAEFRAEHAQPHGVRRARRALRLCRTFGGFTAPGTRCCCCAPIKRAAGPPRRRAAVAAGPVAVGRRAAAVRAARRPAAQRHGLDFCG